MNAFMQIADRVSSVQEQLDRIIIGLVRDNEHLVIDFNTEQLQKGVYDSGDSITPGYTAKTISIKQEKGQPTDKVTLYDEGDFYQGFYVVYGDSYFALGSDDEKTQKLERKYGQNIFGLTEDNKQELVEHFKDELISILRSFLTQSVAA